MKKNILIIILLILLIAIPTVTSWDLITQKDDFLDNEIPVVEPIFEEKNEFKTNYSKVKKEKSGTKVEFIGDIETEYNLLSIMSAIQIKDNHIVEINSQLFADLNKPAKLTFTGKHYNSPVMLRNNVQQTNVKIKQNNYEEYELNISGFSTWIIVDDTFNGTRNNTALFGTDLRKSPDAKYIATFNNNTLNSSFVTDYSLNGNNVDTATPSRSTNCKYGNECYGFDGVNDYITTPLDFAQNQNLTFMTKLRLGNTASGNGDSMFIFGNLFLHSGNDYFYIYATDDYSVLGAKLNAGEWYDLVYTQSGQSDTARIYINETPYGFSGTASNILAVTDAYIGRHQVSDLDHFNGEMECQLYYNKTANLTEITLYQNWTTCSPDNIAYYSFDTDATDNSNNGNDGTVTSATFNATGGILSGAYEFDGDNDYINIGDQLDIRDNDLTITAWIKPVQNVSATSYYFISKADTSGVDGRYGLRYRDNTFDAYLDTTDTEFADGSINIPVNQWTFITAVYDRSGNLTTYVNGVKDGIVNISSADGIDYDTNINFNIGSLDGPSFLYNGTIDEVGMWNRALTVAEIVALNASGVGVNPYDGLVSVWNMSEYKKNVTDSYGSNHGDAQVFQSWLVETPLLYVGFDENNGSHPYNTVNNNITTGNTGTFTTGYSGLGMSYSGNNQRSDLNDINLTGKEMSVSAWFNLKQITTTYGSCILCKSYMGYGSGGASRGEWGLYVDSLGTSVRFKQYGNTDVYQVEKGNSLLNKWYHIVATNNNTHLNLYRDGVLYDTVIVNSSDLFNQTQYGLAIGGDPRINLQDFNGSIDEVQIFDRAITQTEITNLYNNSPHTINSMEFDGVDDNIDFGTSPLYTENATNFSTSMWIYTNNGNFNGGVEIVMDSATASGNDGFFIAVDDRGGALPTNGLLVQAKVVGGTVDSRVDNIISNEDSWHHIVTTYNGTNLLIYVNGVDTIATQTGDTGNFVPNNANLYLASQNDDSLNFKGNIDEVQIFDRSLSLTEVQDIYNGSPIRKYYESGTYETNVSCAKLDFDNDTVVANVKLVGVTVDDVSLINLYLRSGTLQNLSNETYVKYNLNSSGTLEITNESEVVRNCTQSKLLYNGIGAFSASVSNITMSLDTVELYKSTNNQQGYLQIANLGSISTDDSVNLSISSSECYNSTADFVTITHNGTAKTPFGNAIYDGFYNSSLINDSENGNTGNISYETLVFSDGVNYYNNRWIIPNAVNSTLTSLTCTGERCVAKIEITNSVDNFKLLNLNISVPSTNLSNWAYRTDVIVGWSNLSTQNTTIYSSIMNTSDCSYISLIEGGSYIANVGDNGTVSNFSNVSLTSQVFNVSGTDIVITQSSTGLNVDSVDIGSTFELVIDYGYHVTGDGAGGGGITLIPDEVGECPEGYELSEDICTLIPSPISDVKDVTVGKINLLGQKVGELIDSAVELLPDRIENFIKENKYGRTIAVGSLVAIIFLFLIIWYLFKEDEEE